MISREATFVTGRNHTRLQGHCVQNIHIPHEGDASSLLRTWTIHRRPRRPARSLEPIKVTRQVWKRLDNGQSVLPQLLGLGATLFQRLPSRIRCLLAAAAAGLDPQLRHLVDGALQVVPVAAAERVLRRWVSPRRSAVWRAEGGNRGQRLATYLGSLAVADEEEHGVVRVAWHAEHGLVELGGALAPALGLLTHGGEGVAHAPAEYFVVHCVMWEAVECMSDAGERPVKTTASADQYVVAGA